MTGSSDDGRLQQQARALGDPTRHAIFRLIDSSDEPVGVRELAGAVGLHESAVRQHLAKLVGAELVLEARTAPVGPGRPRSLYRRAPGVLGVWGTENPFERLAALLIDVLRSGTDPRQAGREAGRAIAASPSVQTTAGRPAAPVLAELVAAQGFEPRLSEGPRPEIVLGHCPYASLATVAPEIVCELHHGLAEGMADALVADEPVEVRDLVRRDPQQAGCQVRLRPRRQRP